MRLLNALFSPRRVALVGASDRKGTLGHLLATNLASFPGEVVPVGTGESLRDVDGEIDLAVVAVPAHAVPAVAADAAAKGVAAMVVLSGGFAEVGPDGAKLQAELVANAGATRVIGPNCFGIQNCDLPLNASMAVGLPRGGGGICLVSQSGAYGMAIYTLAADERVRFAKILAPGNTCDVTIAELLGELADDPAAGTLCFLLESLADGRAFVEKARAVTPSRPVVVVKTGRSEAGARAASSHTAALAADTAIWRGVFRQAGIVEVAPGRSCSTPPARWTATRCPQAPASRSSRTPAASAWSCRTCSLTRASPCPPCRRRCRTRSARCCPRSRARRTRWTSRRSGRGSPSSTPASPTCWPAPARSTSSSRCCCSAPRWTRRPPRASAMWWRACAPTAWRCRCTSAGWRPATRGPTRTCCRTRACRASNGPPGPRGRSGTPAATPWRASGRPRPRRAPDVRPGPTPTDPVAAAALLAELGVDTAPSTLCRTADEAVAAATAFPVVVKLAEAAHRTELGGVRLGLADADAVRAAADELLAQGPVLVQRQLSGVEIAVGAVRDPVFGPVVMVGLGGIWVEVLGDVAFAMAPLHRAEARDAARRAARPRPAHRRPRRPGRRPRRARRRRRRGREPAAGLPGRRRARPQPRPRHRRGRRRRRLEDRSSAVTVALFADHIRRYGP